MNHDAILDRVNAVIAGWTIDASAHTFRSPEGIVHPYPATRIQAMPFAHFLLLMMEEATRRCDGGLGACAILVFLLAVREHGLTWNDVPRVYPQERSRA